MIDTRRMPVPLRAAILIVAIAALLGVAMASNSAAHFHAGSARGQCDICITAHVVSLEARAVFQFFGSLEVHERLTPAPVIQGYKLFLAHSSFSRGPPLFSL